ncbi:MAG: ASCH domain-containing protein [Thiobacillus sp.]
MKERPMLMSAPMVRAILAGTKTQTRRVVKPQPGGLLKLALHLARRGLPIWFCDGWDGTCPYGQPGDQLWVRETFAPMTTGYAYLADPVWRDSPSGRWHPSIHMPRVASRITLEIVSVRVERLQDISESDALAEGVSPDMGLCWQSGDDTPRGMYGELWESINGPGSWDANPWVWVVEFKRVTP